SSVHSDVQKEREKSGRWSGRETCGRERAASRRRERPRPRRAVARDVDLARPPERTFRANARAEAGRLGLRKATRAESQTWIAQCFSTRLFCRPDNPKTSVF